MGRRDRIRFSYDDSLRETPSSSSPPGGNTGQGGDRTYSGLYHGTDEQGNDVTAAFGREDTPKEGHTFLADGHKDANEFYGENAEYPDKGHDHYNGRGGGTSRGRYTGEGS